MTRTFRTPAGTDLPLLILKGKEYLEVKYRLVWFREDCPDWPIITELISSTDDATTARASILDPAGRIMATSHKRETRDGFPDHLEKSETGAIGRALALCGYGTQFCADDLDEGSRIVDAPVGIKTATPTAGSDPIQPEPLAAYQRHLQTESVSSSGIEDQEITFGKYKGLTPSGAVEQDGIAKLLDYVKWLDGTALKSGKPISSSARALKVAIERISESNSQQ